MSIITSLRRIAVVSTIAALFAVPAFAGDEEFPDGPKPDGGDETLPGSEEKEMEEEEPDVLGTLEDIIGKMKDAESSLAQAGTWKATDAQGNAIEDADKLLSAKDMQDKAIREMTKIFDGSKQGQAKAVEGIEKLIKAAKESQGGEGDPKKQQGKKDKPEKQPGQQKPKNPSNPAQQPYNPSGNSDDGSGKERTAEMTDRWGNLPDRLRDEISQADDEFRTTKGNYREKLMEYSRVLGATE